MTPDEQAALSRKYTAAPVAVLYLSPEDGYALFRIVGSQRELIAIGPWHELEAHLPPETPGITCASPWDNKPPPPTVVIDVDDILGDL